MKGLVLPGTLFEELGFNYIEPVHGHDLEDLVSTLTNIKDLSGPQFLHVVTQKGRGYEPAEKNPVGLHALQDRATGQRSPEDRREYAKVLERVRDMARGHRGAGRSRRRHHARDARRLGSDRLLGALSRALSRRCHSGAARSHARSWLGM